MTGVQTCALPISERHMADVEARVGGMARRGVGRKSVGFFLNTGDESDACNHHAALAAFGATKKGGPLRDRP